MPLPPLRHPPRPERSRERGSVGSARVWSAEERERGTPARPLQPVPPAPSAEEAVLEERLLALESRRPVLAQRLREALGEAELSPTERTEVVGQVLSWTAAPPASHPSTVAPADAPAPASTEDLRALDILERRLAKVRGSLRNAWDLRRRLESLGDHDPGIASIYRKVQGLAEMDAMLEVKREMLREIFRANLALQTRTA